MQKSSHALIRQKWFLALLILVPLLCCVVIGCAIVLVLVKTGSLSVGHGADNILLGIPNRSSQFDLYLLRLGEEVKDGTLLVEDALTSDMYLSYYQDGEFFPLGNYYQGIGGFVPEQELLVIWYEEKNGDLFIQRHAINEASPETLYDSHHGDGYARVLNEGQDIFINARVNGEERCYVSLDGESAQRITTGDTCYLTHNGAYVITEQWKDNEITLTIMNLDGSEEVTLIDAQEGIEDYRVSFDGSRIVYVTQQEQSQVILLDGRNSEVIAQGEPVFQVLASDFSANSNQLFYIAENDDGELALYLLNDSGQVLITTGTYLQAMISDDGAYILYSVGDLSQNYTVYTYDVGKGRSTQILQGGKVRLSLVRELERLFITQQKDHELTVFSSDLDGSDLVILFSDDDISNGVIFYNPDRSDLFIYTSNGDSENSIFYTPYDQANGYYLLREYPTLAIKDFSPDGEWLLAVTSEDNTSDPALTLLRLKPDQPPLILDESEAGFTTAVFSENSKQVIYTVLTGQKPDDCEVRQVSTDMEEGPETLYQGAHLIDVQWTPMYPFTDISFSDPLKSTSLCPGAPLISTGSIMEGSLTQAGAVCYRFRSNAGQLFTFNVEANDFDATLELYDREGNLIDSDDDSGPGLNPRLVASLPADGIYYIKVLAYGGGTGSYSISLQEGISDTSIAIPLKSNGITRDYINNSDDIYLESTDYSTYGVLFYFDGTSNELISIDVIANSQGSEIDPFIYLYDASLNILMTDDDSGIDNDAQIIYNLPSTGRYYILIEDLGGSYGPETDYWFDILLSR